MSIHDYAERGWLQRVVRGVYRRPLPHSDQAGRPLVRTEDDWQLPLLSIQWIMGHVDKNAIDLGSGPRALAKGGKLHPIYRIYVPETLLPADRDEDASHA